MNWNIDYADKETMVSLQQLMVERKEAKGLTYESLGAGEGRSARSFLSPGYLEGMVPLRTSTIAALKTILIDLGLKPLDFDTFHQKRLASASQINNVSQNQNPHNQSIRFENCDLSSAKVISGNQQVNVTFKD